jgi:hypothetical protein
LDADWGQDGNSNKYSLWYVIILLDQIFSIFVFEMCGFSLFSTLSFLNSLPEACNLINNEMKQFIISSETDAIREVENRVSSIS